MSTSSSADLKRALRAYVLGRDSGASAETKRRMAAESLRAERPDGGPSGVEDTPGPSAATESPPQGRFGVPVPSRLDFHRSASRWRDLIPGLKSGGA